MQPDMNHVPSTTLIQIGNVRQSRHFCNDRQIGQLHKILNTNQNRCTTNETNTRHNIPTKTNHNQIVS